ncbi:hypothetical protein Taro_041170 [Colocasia esculenta]|uniref:Uncharacterized protein n=1 Tax=Colocasia esculenta TaxID=4460 RepID=A0A843WWJ6_COLES|nr:hypothetical protein [Colocasia esculenta]
MQLRKPQHYQKQLKRPWNQARRDSGGLEVWLKEKTSRNLWRERLKASNLMEVDVGGEGPPMDTTTPSSADLLFLARRGTTPWIPHQKYVQSSLNAQLSKEYVRKL